MVQFGHTLHCKSSLCLSIHLPPPRHLPHQQCDVSGCYRRSISTPMSHIIKLSYWYYVRYNITNDRQIGRN